MDYDIQKLRKMIAGLDREVPLTDGCRVCGINLDNAATTPPFRYVLETIVNFSEWYSSIHRGNGYKSQMCSDIYDEARERIISFVGGERDKYDVIFVKNTTEALNKLSFRLKRDEDTIFLTTRMEHHSNDLPWRGRFKTDYVDIDDEGELNINSLRDKLVKHKGRVKYLSVTGASNVTGFRNDIHLIARLCHEFGAKIIVDGAQLVPHARVNIKGTCEEERIDYIAFSAHKMYAPFGIGVLITPKGALSEGEPEYKGGGTVEYVTPTRVIWTDGPEKEESGTPNIIGVVSLLAAMIVLKELDLDKLLEEEIKLTKYTLDALQTLPVRIYGSKDIKNRLGIIPFDYNKLHHEYIAQELSSKYGVAVRSGCFCAQPYVQRLLNMSEDDVSVHINDDNIPSPGILRVSFGVYNTKEEIDKFICGLDSIIRENN